MESSKSAQKGMLIICSSKAFILKFSAAIKQHVLIIGIKNLANQVIKDYIGTEALYYDKFGNQQSFESVCSNKISPLFLIVKGAQSENYVDVQPATTFDPQRLQSQQILYISSSGEISEEADEEEEEDQMQSQEIKVGKRQKVATEENHQKYIQTAPQASKEGQSTPITVEELQRHNTEKDLWVSVKGKVYDLTKYLKFHPGGTKILMKVAGMDATKEFNMFHGYINEQKLVGQYQMGVLKKSSNQLIP